ncbi:MAG: porin family protein [Bacteroidales bacterium]
MKQFIILLVLSSAFVNAFSQRISYGIGAGLNYSNLIFNNIGDEDSDYKIGFQLNALLEYNFNKTVGFRIEPGFVNRGTLNDAVLLDSKININYITAPLLIKISPIDNFAILLGPEYAWRLTAKATTDGKTTNVKSIYDSKFDIGINAGISYRFVDKIEIGLRYNRGFISTVKDLRTTDEYGNLEGKAKICNHGFTFLITYIIK